MGKKKLNNSSNSNNNTSLNLDDLNLSPQKIAIIAALMTDVLQTNSVTVDKEQTVFVELTGSLRRKTRADQMVEEMKGMSFGEILEALTR
ncbi:hypothetical protein [Virgibacillus siamensis]|uniref:hypothetical protein n=1 Tax=Virgibacillus siamensis TaxID=480071 RepID=UPI0009842B57|nr:hypothetical protein [Virgibacillus siamensis]